MNHTANVSLEGRSLPKPSPQHKLDHPKARRIPHPAAALTSRTRSHFARLVDLSKRGRLALGRERIAGELGLCVRQAIRVIQHAARLGLLHNVREGGFRWVNGRLVAEVNIWRVNMRIAHALLGDTLKPAEMSPYDALEVPSNALPIDQHRNTVRRGGVSDETERRKAKATAPRWSEPWRSHKVVAWNDPRWQEFRDSCKRHTVGITEPLLFRMWCTEVRRGADPEQMAARYRELVAAYESRGWHPKGGASFLRERAYRPDWPMPELVQAPPPKPKDETFEQMVERRAKACGLYARPGEEYRDLWERIKRKLSERRPS